jgi:hypothetical protein
MHMYPHQSILQHTWIEVETCASKQGVSNPIDTCIYVCIYLSFIQVEQTQTRSQSNPYQRFHSFEYQIGLLDN